MGLILCVLLLTVILKHAVYILNDGHLTINVCWITLMQRAMCNKNGENLTFLNIFSSWFLKVFVFGQREKILRRQPMFFRSSSPKLSSQQSQVSSLFVKDLGSIICKKALAP